MADDYNRIVILEHDRAASSENDNGFDGVGQNKLTLDKLQLFEHRKECEILSYRRIIGNW